MERLAAISVGRIPRASRPSTSCSRGGDRQGFALAGAGSLGGSFVEHVDQDGPVLVVVGYERDNRYLLSLSGGALHPGLGRGRDVSGPGGGYGRTVAGAERDGPFQRQALQDFVALPAQDLAGFKSQYSFCPGIPEDDVLFQVDGEGAVGGCFQPVQ
jgi:hypothetical protein